MVARWILLTTFDDPGCWICEGSVSCNELNGNAALGHLSVTVIATKNSGH